MPREVVLNSNFRFTSCRPVLASTMLALNGGPPRTDERAAVLDLLLAFPPESHRPRNQVPSSQARDRAHVLVGLAIGRGQYSTK